MLLFAQIVLGALCPLTLAIICWWIPAGLSVSGLLQITDKVIAFSALTGLVIGVILDIFFLKKWASRLFDADIRLVTLLFLFWSLAVFAFFMGVPVGNLVLGTFAAAYCGARFAVTEQGSRSKLLKASVFIAVVSGAASITAVSLALTDPWTRSGLGHLFGLRHVSISRPWLISMAIAGCMLFTALQYLCSSKAGRYAFRYMSRTMKSASA